MGKVKLSLTWQIVIGPILGIAVGAVLGHFSAEKVWRTVNVLQPVGNIFIRPIKMIVMPVVISSLMVDITGVDDTKKLGRISLRIIICFETVTTVAIVVGLLLANLFQPGTGIDMSTLGIVDISRYQKITREVQHDHAFTVTTLNLIPSSVLAAIVCDEMLPIIFFPVMFGPGLSSLSNDLREPLVKMFQGVSETMFKVTHMVTKYAPIGTSAPIMVIVANFDFASLLPLTKPVILVYAAIVFFTLAALGLIARMFGLSIMRLIRIFKDDLVLIYSTASPETVLPRIIEKMETYGASKAISSFVVPTGYPFSLDGPILYQSTMAIFIARLYSIDPSIGQQIMLMLTLMVTPKGIASVPGMLLVVLLAILGSIGVPLEGLAFITDVDRIVDMARTALNVIGSALAVLVISEWEGVYDAAKGQRYRDSLPYLRQTVDEVKGKRAILEQGGFPPRRPRYRPGPRRFWHWHRLHHYHSCDAGGSEC